MADLDRLLRMLSPAKLCEMDFEVDDAYKRFPLDSVLVDTFPEFQRLLGRYYRHLWRAVYGCDVSPDTEDAEALVTQLVERVFEGGRIEAFGRASSGRDGGLPEVLQKVAQAFKEHVFEAYLRQGLGQTVDLQDWEDREKLMRAYVKKYGHLLPSNVDSVLPAILAAHPKDILRAHVHVQQLLNKLPSQG